MKTELREKMILEHQGIFLSCCMNDTYNPIVNLKTNPENTYIHVNITSFRKSTILAHLQYYLFIPSFKLSPLQPCNIFILICEVLYINHKVEQLVHCNPSLTLYIC